MKKFSIMISIILTIVVSLGVLTACDDNSETNYEAINIKWMDGDKILSTTQLLKGSSPTKWLPTKKGFYFDNWYSDPEFKNEFDFSKPINNDISVYALFQGEVQNDLRTWYIMGQGNGTFLHHSLNEANPPKDFKMVKSTDARHNRFCIDNIVLLEGDEFAFVPLGNPNEKKDLYVMKDKESSSVKNYPNRVVAKKGNKIYFEQLNQGLGFNIKTVENGVYSFTLLTNPGEERFENLLFERTGDIDESMLPKLYNMYYANTKNNPKTNANFYASDTYQLKEYVDDENKVITEVEITDDDLEDDNFAHCYLINHVDEEEYKDEANLKLSKGLYHVVFDKATETVTFEKMEYYLLGMYGSGDNLVVNEFLSGKLELNQDGNYFCTYTPSEQLVKLGLKICVGYGTSYDIYERYKGIDNKMIKLDQGTYTITFYVDSYYISAEKIKSE